MNYLDLICCLRQNPDIENLSVEIYIQGKKLEKPSIDKLMEIQVYMVLSWRIINGKVVADLISPENFQKEVAKLYETKV